jgi:hypothetical protein
MRQEVKYRTVMPDIHLLRQTELSCVSREPGHTSVAIAKARPGYTQRSLRNVDDGQLAVPPIKKLVNK